MYHLVSIHVPLFRTTASGLNGWCMWYESLRKLGMLLLLCAERIDIIDIIIHFFIGLMVLWIEGLVRLLYTRSAPLFPWHSLIHSLIYSYTQSLTHSLIHLLNHSRSHSSSRKSIRPKIPGRRAWSWERSGEEIASRNLFWKVLRALFKKFEGQEMES